MSRETRGANSDVSRGAREGRMETRLDCQSCGNRCLTPPSDRRAYSCPRCGERLIWPAQMPGGSHGAASPWSGVARLRYLAMLGALFGLAALGVPGGVVGPRAASSAPETGAGRAAPLKLSLTEQRNYVFRLRQLERDLRRDGVDFDVLRRLGQLHLRLAATRIQGRESHLRRARFYLRQAVELTQSVRESQIARGLLDAANSPNPMVEWIGMPGEYGPPPRIDEGSVRYRIGWLEEQVGLRPNSSRTLCRLADNYSLLYQVLMERRPRRPSQWPHASGVNDPEEARRLAEHDYRRALACATTNEARCRALYGTAQLWRVTGRPERAAAYLEQMLTLQPNNWFAALEMARLCRQMGREAEASRYESQSARWRTPGWI